VTPAWSVHLPTVDATWVRLRLRPHGERDPWPFSLALTRLAGLGAVSEERFRSLGAGRGRPLLASQELSWRGGRLHLETTLGRDGVAELALALPCWDELVGGEATEEDLWELVDGCAEAVDAAHGAVGDGEPLEEPEGNGEAALPSPGRHLGVLLPGHAVEKATALAGAASYRELPLSGLTVVLR
jgi:hypothetical protein